MSAIVESLTSVIDFLPGATLLVDRNGGVLRSNESARRLLDIGQGDSLFDIANDRGALRELLLMSRRSSGSLPVAFDIIGSDRRISGTLKPVRDEAGEPAGYLLLACQTRYDAACKMRMLNRELDRAIERQRVLKQQNDSLRHTVEETLPRLQEQTFRDPLTGAYNRRYFDRQLEREWRRAIRQGTPLSLVYADIDHFKQYNDALGHHRGDRCLQAVARAFKRALTRKFDGVCRLGGEEFALLLPMTPAEGARRVAARAMTAVHRLKLRHPDNVVKFVTASFGVGSCVPSTSSFEPDEFVAAVDREMYCAKRAGRNRISVLQDAGSGADPADEPRGLARA